MLKRIGVSIGVFSIVGLWLMFVLGWFINLFALFGAQGNELWIRIAGLFIVPAGSLMGWFY